MDNLRIILVICGVLLLAGIYFWGVTVARRDSRSEKPKASEDEVASELELLERVQDARAAQNAESLKELNEIDIDAELEQDDEEPTEPREVPAEEKAEVEAEAEAVQELDQPREDLHDSGQFRPVFAKEARDEPAEARSVPEKTDLVASLAEIQATLAPEPVMEADQLDLLREEIEPEPPPKARQAAKASPSGNKGAAAEQLVLAITVMAKEGTRFEGADVRNWMEALKLRHGDMGLFHYRPPGKPLRAPPTYSIASVIKPGGFDFDQMEDITIPGVAMFVQLPGPDDPVSAFEEMLRTARKLAEGLDGVVCDESRSTLTGQAINHMRERIAEFSRKQRLRF